MSSETLDQSQTPDASNEGGPAKVPGLVLVFAGGKPAHVTIPLSGDSVELGRDHPAFAAHPDQRLSRRHFQVRFDGRRFHVTDLGSRNGTQADGDALQANTSREVSRVLRAGDSVFLVLRDIAPIDRFGVRVADRRVEGPALQEVLRTVAQAARHGSTLHITGESGAGKEGLARTFHTAGPVPGGPFVAVNCATIPEGVAERLLFGAKRGAFSGADADADGHLQAAHGGTLFLDEVAELSLAVQAKLLRVLETGEVLPLGASKPRKIELRFCSATHRDLRAQVADKKLREDLYYRIAMPRVTAPPLRERPEEIPWLLTAELARMAPDLIPHVSLVETCMLRVWPGNVRELLAEARTAAQVALATENKRVEARHLSADAGSAFSAPKEDAHRPLTTKAATSSEDTSRMPPPSKAKLAGVLKKCEGNISAAARQLGVHRTQLRRWLERHDMDVRVYVPQVGPCPTTTMRIKIVDHVRVWTAASFKPQCAYSSAIPRC